MPLTNEDLTKVLDTLIDDAVSAKAKWSKQAQRHKYDQTLNSGFTTYQNELRVAHEKAMQLIKQRESQLVREARLEYQHVITTLLNEYANTRVGERGNGWDWLVKARDLMLSQHPNTKEEE